jgi:hypothetical protein
METLVFPESVIIFRLVSFADVEEGSYRKLLVELMLGLTGPRSYWQFPNANARGMVDRRCDRCRNAG